MKHWPILIIISMQHREEMTHQQQMSCSGSHVIECRPTAGESRQCPPLAFVPEEDILSICGNKNDVI